MVVLLTFFGLSFAWLRVDGVKKLDETHTSNQALSSFVTHNSQSTTHGKQLYVSV